MNQLLALFLLTNLNTGTIEERLEDRILICEEVSKDILPECIEAISYVRGREDAFRECLFMIRQYDNVSE